MTPGRRRGMTRQSEVLPVTCVPPTELLGSVTPRLLLAAL